MGQILTMKQVQLFTVLQLLISHCKLTEKAFLGPCASCDIVITRISRYAYASMSSPVLLMVLTCFRR